MQPPSLLTPPTLLRILLKGVGQIVTILLHTPIFYVLVAVTLPAVGIRVRNKVLRRRRV